MHIEVLKRFPYKRKWHNIGDTLEVPEKDGKLLILMRKATLSKEETKDTQPVQTRSLEAENAESDEEISPRTGKPKRKYTKRTYKRRDMQAESE